MADIVHHYSGVSKITEKHAYPLTTCGLWILLPLPKADDITDTWDGVNCPACLKRRNKSEKKIS